MKIIVDTCIWSLALRRSNHNVSFVQANQLKELIFERRVELLGAVRQELLSGIAMNEQFEKLKVYLRAFPDLKLIDEDYELAAHYFNRCRSKGIQGSSTDFLICAAATQRDMAIFTIDKDFQLFTQEIPVKLF